MYNWEQKDWPHFTYSLLHLEDELWDFAQKVGRVSGILDALPSAIKQETIVEIILAEAIKTSAIEGEYPNRNDVLSSIRKNLGLHDQPERIKDQSALGLGELMIDVRKTFQEPLTQQKIFDWHRMLMGQQKKIQVGQWRSHDEPMQVVSGEFGNEIIHFEAPPTSRVASEMKKLIKWFNDTAPGGNQEIKKAPVRAGIAHLYFETIHPFEDGNGRIGRAIAEKALAQTLGRPVVLSLSKSIESRKKEYYEALKKAQQSNEITSWIEYFVRLCVDAQTDAQHMIEFTLQKTIFFDRFMSQLNERQNQVINRMFEEGPQGFKGGMNAKKYMTITKTSKATATRDLQHLLEIEALIPGGAGGRSTNYQLNIK